MIKEARMAEAVLSEANEGIQNSKIVANPAPVSSLTLQVIISVDYYVQWIFCLTTGVLLFWKIYQYSFPLEFFLLEVGLFVLLACAQFMRLFLGSRGNKTESSTVTFFFLLITLGTLVGNLYFLGIQTYVIVAEALIGVVVIAFSLLEILFGIIAAIEFKSLENSQ